MPRESKKIVITAALVEIPKDAIIYDKSPDSYVDFVLTDLENSFPIFCNQRCFLADLNIFGVG